MPGEWWLSRQRQYDASRIALSWPPAFPTARPPSLPGDLATSRPELLWQHTLVSLAPLALEYCVKNLLAPAPASLRPIVSLPRISAAHPPAPSPPVAPTGVIHSLARAPTTSPRPAPTAHLPRFGAFPTAIRSTSPCVRPASAVATKAHLSVLTSQHRRRCSHEALHIRDRRADRRDERRGCPLDYMDR